MYGVGGVGLPSSLFATHEEGTSEEKHVGCGRGNGYECRGAHVPVSWHRSRHLWETNLLCLLERGNTLRQHNSVRYASAVTFKCVLLPPSPPSPMQASGTAFNWLTKSLQSRPCVEDDVCLHRRNLAWRTQKASVPRSR